MTAYVTTTATGLEVTLVGAPGALPTQEGQTEAQAEEPNPILPVGHELMWTAISFALLFVLILILLPRVTRGMEARTNKVRSDAEDADRANAEADRVDAEIQAALVGARADATRVFEEARTEVESIRAARLAEVGAELAAQRAAAAEEATASRAAAMRQLHDAVTELAAQAAERVLERPVDRERARRIAEDYVESQEVGAR